MSITTDDIKHLANLGRLELTDEEVETYKNNLEAISGYVSLLENVGDGDDNARIENALVSNVLRDDEVTTESGTYTKTLIHESAPETEGDYVKVKKIL